MRRTNKFVNIVNLILFVILISSFVSVINMDVDTNTLNIKNEHLLTYLKSNHIEKTIALKNEEIPIVLENKENVKEADTKNNPTKNEIVNTKKQESTNKKVDTPKKEEAIKKDTVEVEDKKIEVLKEEKAIEKLTGSLAGYGPDCAGCTSFRTASGRYIGDGKIYYDDKEYGKIRIVAGDKSYPFGTIVKISNTNYGDNSPIYAIVLDRGGGVGKGKKFLFDLLFATEKEASKAGSRKNVTFEILRLGY